MRHSHGLLCAIFGALLVSCTGGPAHGESVRSGPGFETVAQGSYSGIIRQREVVIESNEAFERLWRELHAGRSPLPALPEIDFARYQIVALFLGEKPTGGHSIDIRGVVAENEHRTVYYEERQPAPGDLVTQALTQPYHIVRIPRAQTEIRFRRHRDTT